MISLTCLFSGRRVILGILWQLSYCKGPKFLASLPMWFIFLLCVLSVCLCMSVCMCVCVCAYMWIPKTLRTMLLLPPYSQNPLNYIVECFYIYWHFTSIHWYFYTSIYPSLSAHAIKYMEIYIQNSNVSYEW